MERPNGPAHASLRVMPSRRCEASGRRAGGMALVCTVLAASLLFLAAPACHAQQSAPPKRPQVWMMPSPWPGNGASMKELLTREGEWAQTRALVNGFGYWPSLLYVHFSDAEIRTFFEKAHAWKLPVNIEVEVLKKEYPTARKALDHLEDCIKRFRPLGFHADLFSFDEPFYNAKHVMSMPDADAVREVVEFMRSLQATYQGARTCLIEPYPAFAKDDILAAVGKLQAACRLAGIKGIDTLRLDVDWCAMGNWLMGSWREVKQIEDACHKLGIRFSLICWAADYPMLKEKGLATDLTWYVGAMHTYSAYIAAGGAPDEIMVESWVHVPEHAVPETAMNTFTRSVLDLARVVKGTK